MAKGIQLSTVLARPDPLLTFRWVAKTIPDVGGTFGVGPEYIENFEIPFNNVKSEGVFFGGGYKYFPSFHDISAFNVTFYGDSDGRTIKYLMAWKNLVKDFKTGIYNLPDKYKRAWNVILLDPAGNEVFEVELSGCWPADTGQLSLTSEGSDRLTFNQNFSLDNSAIVGI